MKHATCSMCGFDNHVTTVKVGGEELNVCYKPFCRSVWIEIENLPEGHCTPEVIRGVIASFRALL